jgi:hypothetical protein
VEDDIVDVSGNGNHATIIGGTTGTEGVSTWAGRIDGLANASNLTRGFALFSDGGGNFWRSPYNGINVPAWTGNPAGYTLVSENPAIIDSDGKYGHNDAETTEDPKNVSETGTPTPGTNHLPDTITFSQDRPTLLAISPVDSMYRRDVSEVSKDRMIFFGGTLTGDDKQLALDYTHPLIGSGFSSGFDDGF